MNISEFKDYAISSLSEEQRARLAHELWESLDEDGPLILSKEEQQAEIRRRTAAADAGAMASYSWEEVKQDLLDRKA